MLNAAV